MFLPSYHLFILSLFITNIHYVFVPFNNPEMTYAFTPVCPPYLRVGKKRRNVTHNFLGPASEWSPRSDRTSLALPPLLGTRCFWPSPLTLSLNGPVEDSIGNVVLFMRMKSPSPLHHCIVMVPTLSRLQQARNSWLRDCYRPEYAYNFPQILSMECELLVVHSLK